MRYHIYSALFFLAAFFLIVHRTVAQTGCLTRQQVAQDASRCLFIYNNNVYEMGSQPKGHKGHPCGMDVSSIIPNSHISTSGIATHLTGNTIGSICQTTVTPQAPTATPTSIPPTTTSIPPSPTATIMPTATSAPILSQVILPTIPANCVKSTFGDADCNGKIELLDYVCWLGISQGQINPQTAACKTADFDNQGGITQTDYFVWLTHYLYQ